MATINHPCLTGEWCKWHCYTHIEVAHPSHPRAPRSCPLILTLRLDQDSPVSVVRITAPGAYGNLSCSDPLDSQILGAERWPMQPGDVWSTGAAVGRGRAQVM